MSGNKIGVYGGTFNPPHLGHMQAAEGAKAALGLDKLFLVPAAVPPHKTLPAGSPSPEERLQMLRLAAEDCPGLEVLDWELKREGPSYTVDTLRQLKKACPEDALYLLMGTDMFLSFDQWYQSREIASLATLVAFAREKPDTELERRRLQKKKAYEKEMGARVVLLSQLARELSSTQVRRLLAFGCGQECVPPKVFAYLSDREFYGIGGRLRHLPADRLTEISFSLADPGRVAHVSGCIETAQKLARRYGACQEQARRAAALHDITKPLSVSDQLILCKKYGIILSDFEKNNPKLLHAKTGAAVARHCFGENAAVCSAILWHTTGKADMTLLEKILYLADFIEPTRHFPGVEEIRDLAEENLDAALLRGFSLSLEFLRESGNLCDPNSVQARDFLLRQIGKGS